MGFSLQPHPSLVVGPQPQHLDRARVVENLVDDAMLNVDPTRAGSGKFSDKSLERRRSLVRVSGENRQYLLGLRTKPGTRKFLCVAFGLPGKDQAPTHQSSLSSHFSTGVFIPFRIDSFIPGIATR